MSVAEKTIYNALPKLPTFNFTELQAPLSHAKGQFCTIDKDGMRVVKDAGLDEKEATRPMGCGIPVRVLLQRFPKWKTLDDKVLRFFGYYIEIVDESTIEQSRLRKVKLQFYLADGTISISETPATVNSGLRRGVTVSRFKLDDVDVFSLCVGGTLRCRGQTYELVDCDVATREFYEVLGMPQPSGLGYPVDAFETRSVRGPATMTEDHIAMRRIVELQAATAAGTHSSLLTPEERAKARNFFEHDQEVLRFYAVWEGRQFRVLYFICDGTIAVMFDGADNDGRDHNAVFLRRRPIPRTGARDAMTDNLAADDLRLGTSVTIYGRSFFLYDCDAFTRAYLAAHGAPTEAVARPATERDALTAAPRGNGRSAANDPPNPTTTSEGRRYGASSMVFADDARRGTRDALKMTRFAHDVLRFGAVLAQPTPLDDGRRFILGYHLADDTISLYEVARPNSGFVAGKIFSRRAVPGLAHPSQLVVGLTVELDGVGYRLVEMDERTRRELAAGVPDVPAIHFVVQEQVAKVREWVTQRFSRATDAFRYFASSALQGLRRENVQELCASAGVRVTEAEMTAILSYIGADEHGWVSLASFSEHFFGQQLMSDFTPRGPPPAVAAAVRGPVCSAATLTRRADTERDATAALRRFLLVTEARRTLVMQVLRTTAGDTYDGNLGVDDFCKCLCERLQVPLSNDELQALVYKFYYSAGVTDWRARRLPLKELQRLIMA